ncbi:MAG: hypothetical protein U0R71_08435 [Solirubrobacterales bacterium]
MRSLLSRLRRHLSYANVMASVAVFLALGGVGYAATAINGKQILKHSIPAGKLKKKTLGANQVKADSLTGAVIDESTLQLVPLAKNAESATTAQSAASAQTATSAQTANSARTATTAEEADRAKTANSAATAGDAETLEGATVEDLEVSCQAGTTLFGGMCWEEGTRPARLWPVAAIECGQLGGRLPTLSELIAYIAQSGTQLSGDAAWVSDIIEVSGSARGVPLAVEENGSDEGVVAEGAGSHGFRCLYYRSN